MRRTGSSVPPSYFLLFIFDRNIQGFCIAKHDLDQTVFITGCRVVLLHQITTADNEHDVVKRERVLMDGLINGGWLQDLSFAKKKNHLVIKRSITSFSI